LSAFLYTHTVSTPRYILSLHDALPISPQVLYHNHRFYMAYTANGHIAIAESESPLGPFTQATQKPLAAPARQIDPFIFIDSDGKDRKSTRLNSSHVSISYAVFCLKKKT